MHDIRTNLRVALRTSRHKPVTILKASRGIGRRRTDEGEKRYGARVDANCIGKDAFSWRTDMNVQHIIGIKLGNRREMS